MNKKTLLVVLLLLSVLLISSCKGGVTGLVTGCRKETRTVEVIKEQKNCDSLNNCICVHKSWAGLGSCDRCKCKEQETIEICD